MDGPAVPGVRGGRTLSSNPLSTGASMEEDVTSEARLSYSQVVPAGGFEPPTH